jgi:hypothetical protein
MTNNPEQRRAFEEWFYDLFPMGIDDKTEALMLKSWQAALAQREQEAPSLCTVEEAAELARQHGIHCHPDGNFILEYDELAKLINADRAKR